MDWKTKGMEWETCRDAVHNHLLRDKSSHLRTPQVTWHSRIQTDLFSQSVGLIPDYILFPDCPLFDPNPNSCACRVYIPVAAAYQSNERCFSLLSRVQSLICPLRGAIPVHCEDLHTFKDNVPFKLRLTHSLCVSPPQHQHCTHSLINTDAQCTCRSVCVGVADGSGWPHLEIRGEPLHWSREADLINKTIIMVLCAYFCRVHSLKCIYRQSELWLSSILHKQSDKCLFSYSKFSFGPIWSSQITVVAVSYCSGDWCQD